jgi:hypothetical protein
MRWVRDNVRHGSWLALVALAINFALSFGHIDVPQLNSEQSLIVAALGLSSQSKGQGHSDHGKADYLCPICIAVSAIANGLASAPPSVPLQLIATAFDRPVEPVRLLVALPRAPFQSRGPPMS